MRQAVPPRRRTFARKMRADSTKAENVLWQALRNKQLGGLKFKRQVPLDGYILDFVCFEARLIVEVDGGQHSESSRDAVRDRHLPARFFHATNDDAVKEHRRSVLRDFAGSQGPAAGPVNATSVIIANADAGAISPWWGEWIFTILAERRARRATARRSAARPAPAGRAVIAIARSPATLPSATPAKFRHRWRCRRR